MEKAKKERLAERRPQKEARLERKNVTRILPSGLLTTLRNSGTNGLSSSVISACKASRSLSSDFFMIVPLSLPGAKLPEGENQNKSSYETQTKLGILLKCKGSVCAQRVIVLACPA